MLYYDLASSLWWFKNHVGLVLHELWVDYFEEKPKTTHIFEPGEYDFLIYTLPYVYWDIFVRM